MAKRHSAFSAHSWFSTGKKLQQALRFRPMLEALEERMVPAVNDSGIIGPDNPIFPRPAAEGNLLDPLNTIIGDGITGINNAATTLVNGLNDTIDAINSAATDFVDALNALDVADLFPDIPHIPAIPHVPGIPAIPLPDTLAQGLGWTYVDHVHHFRDVTGVITQFEDAEVENLTGVTGSQVNFTDFPAAHTSHDFNTFLYVDPGYENLVSVVSEGPEPNGDVIVDANGNRRVMEIEWEAGIGPGPNKSGLDLNPNVYYLLNTLGLLPTLPTSFGNTDTEGDGTTDNGGPVYPKWAWPSVGDRVWFNGAWIYDIGHPEVVAGIPRYRSEIHPPRAVAVMRDQIDNSMPGAAGVPLPIVATDIYLHGGGGLAPAVENAIEAYPNDARGALQVILDPANHPVVYNPINDNFSFDIKLPPKPSPNAILIKKLEVGPGNNESTGIDPVTDYDPLTNVLHVHINLASTGILSTAVYARRLKVGWETPPATDTFHIALTLDSMDVFKKDSDFHNAITFDTIHNILVNSGVSGIAAIADALEVGDVKVPSGISTVTNEGELSFFWLNVNQAGGNEWIRLSDFAGGDLMNTVTGGSDSSPGFQRIPIDAAFDFQAQGKVDVSQSGGVLTLTARGSVLSDGNDDEIVGGNAFAGLFGTPAAAGYTLVGSQAANLTIGAANDTLNLVWGGIGFDITLTHGTYATAASLAAELQNQLDAHLPVVRLQANGYDQDGFDNLFDFRGGQTAAQVLNLGLGYAVGAAGGGEDTPYKHLFTSLSPSELHALIQGDLHKSYTNPEWNETAKTGFRLNFTVQLLDPILATDLGNGVLRLNMGPHAADRIRGDTTDGSERFTVRHVSTQSDGSETVAVSALFSGSGLVTQSYTGVRQITGDGGNFDDRLTIDGLFTIPIDYVGGGNAGDNLVLQNATFNTITHTFTNDHDGSIALDPDGPGGTPATPITYTGLAPIADNMSASNRVFTFLGAAETITLSDDPGAVAGVSRIDSTLGESVDFTNPTVSLLVNASAGAGPDVFDVQAMDAAFNAAATVTAGIGADHFVVETATGTTNAWRLNGQDGADLFNVLARLPGGVALNIDGGGNTDTLIGPDRNDIWNITGANAGNITGVVSSFVNIENLTGGSARDVFHFGNGSSMSGPIRGGAGSNWLDYSAFTTSVVVNLAIGAASRAAGGVQNISNVMGSAGGGDRLIGNSAGGILLGHNRGNTIIAGAGRSVIIGGFGVNTLYGAGGDDLIINGRTAYDANYAVLEGVFGRWHGGLTYRQRITALQAAGPNQLRISTTVFVFTGRNGGVGPRVGRGGAALESTIIGKAGLNWFITNSFRSIADKKSAEVVTIS